jgi:hypothetical protein
MEREPIPASAGERALMFLRVLLLFAAALLVWAAGDYARDAFVMGNKGAVSRGALVVILAGILCGIAIWLTAIIDGPGKFFPRLSLAVGLSVLAIVVFAFGLGWSLFLGPEVAPALTFSGFVLLLGLVGTTIHTFVDVH